MIRVLISCAAMLAVTACATPTVVNIVQPGDTLLSCAELREQIAEAQAFEHQAREERGVTGENVAAVVLFWPALLATYSNTEDAINAASERRDYLMSLYRSGRCDI